MRAKKAIKRIPRLDPTYQDLMVTKLINRVMRNGKKDKTGQEPLTVLARAFDNIKPQMEVKARRIGGAAYQVPIPVRGDRQESLAIRWLIVAANARSNSEFHTFSEKLTAEILDAVNNAGGAVKKKLDTHKMAEANKAFAHFRW